MEDTRKDVKIYGVAPDDHDALSLYSRLCGVSMAEAFGRAVKILVSNMDGVERQLFDKAKAGESEVAVKRRGRRSAKLEPVVGK
jgi:hypothetical protein